MASPSPITSTQTLNQIKDDLQVIFETEKELKSVDKQAIQRVRLILSQMADRLEPS